MAEKPARPEQTYYMVRFPRDEHHAGMSISVMRALEFSEWNVEKSDLAELVKLPEAELTKRRGESAGAEKAAFEQMQALAQTWQDNAVRTMLLDRALEYARTPEVTHTSNEWKRYGEVSGAYWTALARLTRELHPLRFSQVVLFACDGSWSRWDHFNARTRGQVYHYTDMRVIASQTCHGLFVRSVAARPIPPSSRWGHGLPLSARLSLPGRIPNVSSRPIQFPDCRQPAQARHLVGLCRLANVEMRLKLSNVIKLPPPPHFTQTSSPLSTLPPRK